MVPEYVVSYTVKRTGGPADATITSGGREIARIRARGEGTAVLETKGDEKWFLDPRVEGEMRPFSLRVTNLGGHRPVLTIRNHIFEHGGRLYMLTNIPEGLHPANHTLGRRYICRLVNFPFASVSEVDHETWGKLRRHRGAKVGEMEGLGLEGHTVKLSQELQGVALQLAASSYLLYATA